MKFKDTSWYWYFTRWYYYVIFLFLAFGLELYNEGILINPLFYIITLEGFVQLIIILIFTIFVMSIIFWRLSKKNESKKIQ